MENKQKAKNSFLRKNMYYLVLAFILLAIVAVSVAMYIRNDNTPTILDSGNNQVQKPSGDSSIILPDSSSPGEDKPSNPPVEEPDDKPTQTVVSFIIPVDNATVSCDYTAVSLVYNKTLNVYTGHLAIDISAEYGSAVKAVYAGTVESITTSYLTGTTVTIDHGNNLKSVYNSIDAVEGLAQGATVSQGFVIGYVTDNNRQEYKDGPHLHFEVWENGQKISPYKYLQVSEK